MDKNPITKHAMGMQAELGALYDAKTGTLYSGYSPWKKKQLDASQIIIPKEDTKLTISSSLEETRKNSDLDLEASVGVDFGIAKLGGSTKYLQSESIITHEARVDITCIKTNQVRLIPMETLMEMTFLTESLKNCPDATHFVGEVIEGAIGNISMSKKCSSSEESREISVSLEAALRLEAAPNAKIGPWWKNTDNLKTENLQIKVEGAINEPVYSFEFAVKIGPELPKLLKPHNNTLTMKLFPISQLNSEVEVKVRELDECLLEQLSSTLKEAKLKLGLLWELVDHEHVDFFPSLKKQYTSFSHTFSRCISKFRKAISEALPKLKDGFLPPEQLELQQKLTSYAIRLMEQQIEVADMFLKKKRIEREKLTATFRDLESEGLQNFFKKPIHCNSLVSTSVKIILNFAGNGIDQSSHFLEHLLEKTESNFSTEDEAREMDINEKLDWFEDENIAHHILESIEKMRDLKKYLKSKNYDFGFGAVVKANNFSSTQEERSQTCIGDIIWFSKGKGYKTSVRAPSDVEVKNAGNSLQVIYKLSQSDVIPISSIYARWRPIEAGSSSSDKQWDHWESEDIGSMFEINTYMGVALKHGTDYEIQVAAKNIVATSPFTQPVKATFTQLAKYMGTEPIYVTSDIIFRVFSFIAWQYIKDSFLKPF